MSDSPNPWLAALALAAAAPFIVWLARALFGNSGDDVRELGKELPWMAFGGWAYTPSWSWLLIKLGVLVLLSASMVVLMYKILAAVVSWFV